MGTADAEAFRKRLLAERAALEAESEAAASGRAPVALDQQSVGRLSRMDALQGQAMANAVEERRRLAFRQIDAALQRIADGEFGFCVRCGEEIGEKRLEADPKTARCVGCAGPG